MENWVQQLCGILDREEQILSELMKQSSLKTQALKAGDVKDLDGIVNREQPLVLRLQTVEQERISLLEKTGNKGRTLRELSEKAEDKKPELENRLVKMSGIYRKLSRVNKLNSDLTGERLYFYNFISGAVKTKNIYRNDGKISDPLSGSGLMDQKI